MAVFKPQRKTSSGMEDLDIDAATLDGKDSSYYLNYNNLTNKPTVHTTDTWRTISVNGATIFGGATNTAGMNLQAGDNVSISATKGSPNVTIDVKDTVALKTDLADYLPLTGGTITGDLTITYDSEGNGGSFYSSYIGMTDGEYSYGGWYADEGIYLGTGDEAQFYPYGLIFNGDNSSINLNGSNSNIFIPSVCGLINNADGNAFGFDDAGYPTILNHDGRYLQIATDDLAGNYANYLFTEYSGFVPVTEEQGTSGQVLTSNGDGTYKWTAQTSGGGSTAQSVIDLGVITEDPASATNSVLNNITDNGIYVFKFYSSEDSITDCYIMTVNTEEYNDGTKDVHQQISNMGFSVIYYRDGYTGNSEWSCNLKYPQSMGSTTCSSNYNNKKLYLVGATSQAYEANTYSNKNIYIDQNNSLCSLSGGITVNKIWARTNNPDNYGYTVGAAGQVLMSNGATSYWGTISTSGGGGTSSFNSAENITADLESQSPTEFDLDCDTYKELIVCTITQDDIYVLSDDFGNTISCEEKAVMHLNYMSEDGMLLGTMTSDTGVSKPFISNNLSFFAESRSSITLNVIIYGR